MSYCENSQCRRSADFKVLLSLSIIRIISHPNFHAKYGSDRAVFTIQELRLIEGELPGRVTALVLEWAFAHREELTENWELAVAKKPLRKIAPLV